MSRQERPGRHHGPDAPADPELEFPRVDDVTGNTVFGDRRPSLRNLTGEHVTGSLTDPAFQAGVFKIRLAGSRSSGQQAGKLVERRYASRGYQTPSVTTTDPNLRTFVAHRDGVPVGTVGVRMDSPKGLSADDLYKAELDEIRSAGARLCEFTRLAVDDEVVRKRNVLGGLFHTAFLFSHEVRNCDYGVIEVNPRHAEFYRRTIFFEPIGPERINRRVNAPSVLLRVSFKEVKAEFKKYFDAPTRPTGHLMFANWFPPEEAAGVLGRLQKLES